MVKRKLGKGKKIMKAAATWLSVMVMSFPVYAANSLEDTTMVKGTKELLTAVIGTLTGMVVLITIFHAIKNGFAWQNADDQEKPAKKRKFINDIALGILIVCIAGIITAMFAFYGVENTAQV